MLLFSRTRLVLGLALMVCLLASAGSARGQGAKKPITKNIPFKTFDGVTLQGTFYPNPAGKMDAVVLLLHEPDLKKGGSSQQEGWADLAASLQAKGYAVLMFDFRGFGESKEVDPSIFWKQNQNKNYIRGSLKQGGVIDHKNFNSRYLPYLVNDIAAAKAFLDRRNDDKECNSSNLIVIGAGEGATLGALWMANEARRRKDKNPPNALIPSPPNLAEPESKDLAAGIWLSMSPRLGGINVPMSRLVIEVSRDQKVPMAFVYGKSDGVADNFARDLVRYINPKGSKDKDFKFTNVNPIPDTKLAGHKLLGKGSDTETFIVNKYLPSVLEARGAKERSTRHVQASEYWYADRKTGRPYKKNKKAGEEVPAVDLSLFLQGF